MKTKLITIITSLIAVCGLCSLVAPVAPASAATTDICSINEVPDSVKQAAGCENSSPTEKDLGDSLQGIVNGIIVFLGVVAVIVIVIGGVSYMTSSGDAGKLQKAKNTILYACIGLVICVLAFGIVNLTISIVSGDNSSSSVSDDANDADAEAADPDVE